MQLVINTPGIKLKKEYMKARKSILISTLLMAGCSLVPLPASAAIERNGRTYWTFEETWELKDAIDADAAAICEYDYGCELDYRFSLLDQPEYRMMGAMMFPSMVYMTAINPKKETIKFFYNGAGDWTTQVLTMDKQFPLQEFTTFWVEDEELNYLIQNDARKTRYHADLILSDSAAEGITPLFYGSVERNGENWFEPNKEIEISVAGSGLARNRSGFFHQIGISDGTFVGTINYSDCLKSPDYRDGMECRLMFAEDGGIWYLPFETEDKTEVETPESVPEVSEPEPLVSEVPEPEAIPEPESPKSTPESIPEIASISEPVLESTPRIAFASESTPELASEPEPVSEPELDSASALTPELDDEDDILVPFTSIPQDDDHSLDFPWWLAVILLVGDAILVWWFAPIGQGKSKKSKNFKKS